MFTKAAKMFEILKVKCCFLCIHRKFDGRAGKTSQVLEGLVHDLKKITGTINKYSEYKDFKRYVLNKGLKELNNFDKKYQYVYK